MPSDTPVSRTHARRNTTIEWCTHTRNFASGCTEARRVDGTMVPACVRCYARFTSLRVSRMQASAGRSSIHDGVSTATGGHSAVWTGVLRWDRELMQRHFRAMRPGDVTFVNSLSDLWHAEHDPAMLVAFADENRALETRWRGHPDGVPRIVTLTKRGARLLAWQRELFPSGLPAHIMAGVTGGEQADLDDQLQHLLQVNMLGPRVVSIEPMTGPVDLRVTLGPKHPDMPGGVGQYDALIGRSYVAPGVTLLRGGARVGWIIVGAESGRGARPLVGDWVRSLRDQAVWAGIPFFFKQGPGADGPVTSKPELDGRSWTEVPSVVPPEAV